MITRKLDAYLDDFYQTSNKALLLTGARQVGKTVAFRRFAERHYAHYIEINFLKTPAAVSIFDNVKSAQEILTRVSAFTDVPMVPGETFILFDEIQDCQECVTQIKFLVDEGSFRYGLTGSLLGVELKDIRSEPVGYMDIADVFPLDFEEFCSAIGVAPRIVDHLRFAFENRGKSGSVRIIYVDFEVYEKVYLIDAYQKSEKDNLSKSERNDIKKVVELIELQLELQEGGHS